MPLPLLVRGIRGAITVEIDSHESIGEATVLLLDEIMRRNELEPSQVSSVVFSLTPDLNSAFPASFAREMGWEDVPMLDVCEVGVRGSLPRCIRILMHVNTMREQSEIAHIYLREAQQLRPDISLRERRSVPRRAVGVRG